jgi:phosphate ABC transporter ATP-binding protein, PhoT family (TC 3.A.1.7.1)
MMEASNAFEIYNLNVWIEEKHILKDIDNLQIPKNKIFSIMGPSGSGKSTF